jgi:hypothetical protein
MSWETGLVPKDGVFPVRVFPPFLLLSRVAKLHP